MGKYVSQKEREGKTKILRDAEETMRNISKFEFETYKKFSEDMAALILAPTKIRWDVPTILGACILELAEFEKYKVHYEVMKPNFICHLLYSDFDSLMYEIKIEKFEFLSKKCTRNVKFFWITSFSPIVHRTTSSTMAKTNLQF